MFFGSIPFYLRVLSHIFRCDPFRFFFLLGYAPGVDKENS